MLKCDCYQKGVAFPCPHQRVKTLLGLMHVYSNYDELAFQESAGNLYRYLELNRQDEMRGNAARWGMMESLEGGTVLAWAV